MADFQDAALKPLNNFLSSEEMNSLLNADMLQNILAELLGILVTVVFIDTLYEYRDKQRKIEYSQGFIRRLKHLSHRTCSQNLLGDLEDPDQLHLLETDEHVNLWIKILTEFKEYTQEHERLINIYSILIEPSILNHVNAIMFDVEKIVKDMEVTLYYQLKFHQNSALFQTVSIDKFDFTYAEKTVLCQQKLTNFLEQKLSFQYQTLIEKDEELRALVACSCNRKVTFWNVFLTESLLVEMFRRNPSRKKSRH